MYWRPIHSCRKHELGQCSRIIATADCPTAVSISPSMPSLPISPLIDDHVELLSKLELTIYEFSLWLHFYAKLSTNTKSSFSNVCERRSCEWCITCEAVYKRLFSSLCPDDSNISRYPILQPLAVGGYFNLI